MPTSALGGLLSPPCSPASSLSIQPSSSSRQGVSCLVLSFYQYHHACIHLTIYLTFCILDFTFLPSLQTRFHALNPRFFPWQSSCPLQVPDNRPRTLSCLDHADPDHMYHTYNRLQNAPSVSLLTSATANQKHDLGHSSATPQS